jgi:hypothetical protein
MNLKIFESSAQMLILLMEEPIVKGLASGKLNRNAVWQCFFSV